MQPFRAPRSEAKEMIRQVIKESQAIDVNPAKAKGGGKTLSGKASTPRRSPRKTGKQDIEVHSIPCKKGIKLMSEWEASECAKHCEVLRWSTDSGEDEAYPHHDLEGETPTTRLEVNAVSPLEGVSSAQLLCHQLKYGITKKLYRSKGWLYRLLMKEGINGMWIYCLTVCLLICFCLPN